MSLEIREMESKDLDYVVDSWLRTYKESPAMRHPGLVHKDFYRLTRHQISELIARSSQKGDAWVLYDTEEPRDRELKAYIVAEWFKPTTAIIHWVQVKHAHWNKGLCSRLIDHWRKVKRIPEEQNILYTFSSMQMRPRHPSDAKHGFPQHMAKKFNLVYYPWFAFTSMPPGWEAGGS